MSQTPADPRKDRARQLRGWMLGLHATYLIDAGGRLGVFEALRRLGGRAQPERLAAELGYEPWQCKVWCLAACTVGILDYRPGAGYGLAEGFDEILCEAGELPTIHMLASIARDFAGVPHAFRSGERKTFHQHDDDFFFHQSHVAARRAPLVADYALSLPGVGERLRGGGALLDLGAGAGAVLMSFCERVPGLRAVGLEPLPYFAERAREAIAAADLGARVSLRADAAEGMDFVDAFDLVTMVQVFHELPDGEKRNILQRCRRALRPGGRLLIIDRCLPDDEAEIGDRRYTMSVLEQWFEVTWGNVVNTRREIAGMLDETGFELESEDEKAVPTYWSFVAAPL